MSSTGTEDDRARPGPASGFRAVVERYDGEPDQCTIFPAEADRGERATTWITAREPVFVHLAEYR